jgi:hypothetical protein
VSPEYNFIITNFHLVRSVVSSSSISVNSDITKKLSTISMASASQIDQEEDMMTAYSREDAVAAVREGLTRLTTSDVTTVLDLSVLVGQELFSGKHTEVESWTEVREDGILIYSLEIIGLELVLASETSGKQIILFVFPAFKLGNYRYIPYF